jgi:ribosomal protein S18 acetylase RimI-like enzyme
MMQNCINWCKENGVEQLELEVVTQNNRGVFLYERLGFKTYVTKKHALKYSDGTYADEYCMVLIFD